MRKGDFLGTYTGKQFWPLDPQPEDVCLEDIAHGLSQICRFNGHMSKFYSVAAHSLNVEQHLKDRGLGAAIRLYGLLHDASEAYICDIPRPLKRYLSGYKEIEAGVMSAIYKHFNLMEPSEAICMVVGEADNYILSLEAQKYMKNTQNWNLVEAEGNLHYGKGVLYNEAIFADMARSLLKEIELKRCSTCNKLHQEGCPLPPGYGLTPQMHCDNWQG